MTPTKPHRLLPLSVLVATLALATPCLAQESAPSPTPSPASSPLPTAPSADEELRHSGANRAAIEREARRAAKNAARADNAVSKALAEAGKNAAGADNTVSKALAEAMTAAARATAEARAGREAYITGGSITFAEPSRAEREAEVREAILEAQEEQREKEREARDRAREKQQEAQEREREKAQERREAERERREAQRERQREQSDNIDELYDQAMESIDEEEWSNALRPLGRLMTLNTRVDAALYWTGYAQGKLNRTAAALASLARLQKEFPASRWAREGKALEMEVRGKSGQPPQPDQEDDLDLKLMAVSALAQSDPEEAMPLLAKILASPSSPRKIRERSLFVLAQMGSEQAGSAIAEVARGNSSPELQRKAIQYLGIFGGPGNRKILSDVYVASTDNTIRKQILNSFMVSGDKARVLNAARTEKDPALRADAVRLLGVMGGTTELSQMYSTAGSSDEKKDILHALFIGGAIEPVAAAAKGEKDKEVRLVAVRNLGLMGRKSQDVLGELYRVEIDHEVKKEVLNAFFLQNNATRLVEVARIEKDPTLMKEAVHWLSLMNSREARAYMMELLKD